jgi:hypothetical protein
VNPTMLRTIKHFKAVAWVCSASCILTTQAHSAELSKSDATLILSFMGCNPSRVAAVVNGIGPVGLFGGSSGGNSAQVLATCQRNGKATAEQYIFLYDNDIGWFFYEKNDNLAQIRLWTKSGYKQIDAPMPPAPR